MQKNTTEYIILGLLNHEDLNGYDLKKRIDMLISQFWNVGYGQLYPTLKTLQKEGCVTNRSEQSTKGPDRIIYRITDAGKQKLIAWLALPEEKEHVKYEILLKLFFGNLSNAADNIKRIDAFKKQHTADLEQIRLFKENLENVIEENTDHLYYYLTVLFGEHINKSYIEWADEAIDFIRKSLLYMNA